MAFVSAHLWQRHTSSEAKENCSDVLHPPGPQMDLTGHTHSPSGKRPCVRGWVWLCVVGGLGGGGSSRRLALWHKHALAHLRLNVQRPGDGRAQPIFTRRSPTRRPLPEVCCLSGGVFLFLWLDWNERVLLLMYVQSERLGRF